MLNQLSLTTALAVTSIALSGFNHATQALTFNFSQGGYSEGAFIEGTFIGEDFNNDGVISAIDSEIEDFSVSFSGNSTVSAFSQDLSNLQSLSYILGSDFIGNFFNIDGIGASNGTSFYGASGATALYPGPVFAGGKVGTSTTLDTTSQLVRVASVPEPSTVIALVLFGGSLSLLKVRKRG